MGYFPHLPPELIALILDYIHGDIAALKACSLVSHTFLPIAQGHLFENIELQFRSNENIEPMRAALIPVLSHTRKLSISPSSIFTMPSILDRIFDHFMAFRNVRELKIRLDTLHFVDRDLRSTSRYFSQFQPTLQSLDLTTFDRNPKDVIVFITFFPFLEELSLSFYNIGSRAARECRVEVLDPNLLTPLRGTLRVHTTPPGGKFLRELTKVQVLYHTLELGGDILLPGTGISELIAACAPTLRIIRFLHEFVDHADLDSWMTFAACTQLTEIRLPVIVDQEDQDIIKLHTALISTVSSPRLRRIELAFNWGPSTGNPVDFSRETWGALENVLLELARRSGDVIRLVISFQARAQLPHQRDEFMSRFLAVGEVRFELGFS